MSNEDRSDRLLSELKQRYGLSKRFVDKVRPVVGQILDLEIPEGKRTELLELLAESCQRDSLIRKSTAEATLGWQRFMAELERLAEIISRRNR